MNKKCFRVIFSKTLQRLIVTSELAKAEGKAKESNSFSDLQIFARIRPLVFSLFCALGLVSTPTLAETLIIQADKSAPKHQQPIILQTANGLPQVNIQTPNDKGLSHNKYSKFDVDTKGAILNNSRTNVQTQQAGWVQGNPYLAKGEAKIILNEVNSNDPSLLKGYVEVAGKKADVIIANPSGIHCQGCGIINSDRATFTAGKPHIQNGNLESFVVEKGKVKVDGKGLDNSRVDYTEILAREVQVNAGIWSKKEAKVITGKNTVKRKDIPTDLQIIHSNQPLADEAQPQFAVDIGELGGMYSGKIHLIGTENGVGVRNAGHIGASSDTLQIDSKGRIINTGTLNANQAINLTATKGIENKGKIENRQGDIQLNTNADIKQDGSIVSRQGNIQQHADTTISQQGETVAKGNVRYQAKTINASQGSLIAAGVTIQDNHNGEVRTLDAQSAQGKSLHVSATDQATLQGKNIASGTFNLHAGSVNVNHSQNSAHTIVVQGTTGNIDANSALFTAQADLQLKTPQALSTQSSHLTANNIHTEQASLNAKNATWKQTGTDDFHLKGSELITSGAAFSTQGDFKVDANQLDNVQGTLSSAKSLTLKVGKTLNSEGGQLLAGGDLHLTTSNLNNDGGLVYAKRDVEVVATESIRNPNTNSDNKGIVAGKALQLSTTTLSNQQGRVASVEGASITTKGLNNDGGKIATDSQLALNAVEISNNVGAVLAADKANLAFTTLSQKAGRIESVQLALTGNVLNSTEQSQILGEQVNNQQSQIRSGQQLTLSGKGINNQQGEIFSETRSVNLHSQQQDFINQQGKVSAATQLVIKSGLLNNEQGLIQSGGDATLHTADLNNQHTQASQGEVKGILSLGQLTLNAVQLLNQQGYIGSKKAQALKLQQLNNQQGIISSQASQSLTVQDNVQNQAGRISGVGLSIVAKQLANNENGQILSKDALSLSVTESIDNAQGHIAATQAVTVTTKALNNQQGQLTSQANALEVNTQQALNNQQGVMAAQTSLNVTAAGLNNQAGKVQTAQGELTLKLSQGEVQNQQGSINAGANLTLHGGSINNQQGLIFAHQDSHINVVQSVANTAQGKIQSLGALQLNAAQLDMPLRVKAILMVKAH